MELPYRTKCLDGDYRKSPKTDRFCVRCQKDIKVGSPTRSIHIVDHGHMVLHPDDERAYEESDVDGHPSGDLGLYLIGMDCAKILGLEWSRIS